MISPSSFRAGAQILANSCQVQGLLRADGDYDCLTSRHSYDRNYVRKYGALQWLKV